MLTTLAEKVDPKNAAVLVIDVTNDFASEKSPRTAFRQNLKGVQESVGRMEAFIKEARRAGLPIIYIKPAGPGARSEASKDQASRNTTARNDPRTPEEEAWGREFYQLVPAPEDLILEKTRYSAFLDTDLKQILRDRGIQSLLLTGISTNVCVESTARDGFMMDFYVVMVEDCCGAYKLNLHEATMENVRDRFGVVATAAEIQEAWASVLVA
jgi:ureidoacrylate peracid hydrolase